MRFDWRQCGLAAAIVLPTLLAYRPAFNAGYIRDDDQYLTDNPEVKRPELFRRIWDPRRGPGRPEHPNSTR